MEQIALIISILLGISSIIGIGIAVGLFKGSHRELENIVNGMKDMMKNFVTKTEFDFLEKRMCEDRDKNSDQHKDFYDVTRDVGRLNQVQIDTERRLSKIENGIDELLKRTPVVRVEGLHYDERN